MSRRQLEARVAPTQQGPRRSRSERNHRHDPQRRGHREDVATLDLIKAQPELAKFQFRATNCWIDGAHNRSTIKGFYAAGGANRAYDYLANVAPGEATSLH
jgi:hypothetical protein